MKRYIAAAFVVALLPFVASADILSDLQIQLQSALAQIRTLSGQGAVLGASTMCPNLTRNLSFGMSGVDVKELQRFLISRGDLAAGNDTGYFGTKTSAAVKKFQCALNIVCSGTSATTGWGSVGQKTRTAIQNICAASTAPNTMPSGVSTSVVPTASSGQSAAVAASSVTKTHFNIVWVEPSSFNLSRLGWPTSAELRTMVRQYKQMGVGTIVVAYTEFMGCFFYPPQHQFSFYSYYTNSTLSSMDAGHRCVPISDGDFLQVLLDEAGKQGMKVILGLSDAGDVHLNIDIYSNLKNGSTQYVPQTTGHTLNDRISQAKNVAVDVANDLQAKYGSYAALQGWYIPHEESACLDSGNNIYTPIADALKAATPGKLVMISPTADVKVCFNNQIYAQALSASHADIVAYQDGVGAAHRVVNGVGSYYWTDAARDLRIADVTQTLKDLKAAHAQAGIQFWINAELWRMDGTCSANGGYGCAFPATWTSAKKQLASWSAIAPDLMLNEGFLQFDFGIQNATLSNTTNRSLAANFTADYKNYLTTSETLPPPIVHAPPPSATPVLAISASPMSIASGAHATVSWQCLNTQSCSIYKNGALMWSGEGNQSSAFDTGALSQNATYVVKGTEASGAEVSSSPVTVTVMTPTTPSASISVTPTTLISGSHAVVSWTCMYAAMCAIYTNDSVSWSGDGSVSSSAFDTGALTQTTSYYIKATSASGAVATSPTVSVTITAPAVSQAQVSISASPTNVASGGQSTITWSAQNAVSCSVATNGAVWYTGSSVFSSAFLTGALSQSSTYTLTCMDSAGIPNSASVIVAVQ